MQNELPTTLMVTLRETTALLIFRCRAGSQGSNREVNFLHLINEKLSGDFICDRKQCLLDWEYSPGPCC